MSRSDSWSDHDDGDDRAQARAGAAATDAEPELPPEGIYNMDKPIVDLLANPADSVSSRSVNPQAGPGIGESNKMAQLLARAQARQQEMDLGQQSQPRQQPRAVAPGGAPRTQAEKDAIQRATIERQQKLMAKAQGIDLDSITNPEEVSQSVLCSDQYTCSLCSAVTHASGVKDPHRGTSSGIVV